MKNTFLKILISFLLTTTACSDSKKSDPMVDGTQDTGGGVVRMPTKIEVKKAVEQSLALLMEENTFRIIETTGYEMLDVDNFSLQEKIGDIFTSINNPFLYDQIMSNKKISDEALAGSEASMSPLLWESLPKPDPKTFRQAQKLSDYMSMEKVYFVEKGPCPDKDKKNAYAGVTSFTLDARVCFSLENLLKIPLSSLLLHVTGLWVHELAHMSNFDEDMANLLEDMTEYAFGEIYSSNKEMPTRLHSITIQMLIHVKKALEEYGYRETRYSWELDPAEVPQNVKIKSVRHQLGAAFGMTESILTIYEEEHAYRKVFRSAREDEPERRAKFIAGIKAVKEELSRMSEFEDVELRSKVFQAALLQLAEKVDRLSSEMYDLAEYYHKPSAIPYNMEPIL